MSMGKTYWMLVAAFLAYGSAAWAGEARRLPVGEALSSTKTHQEANCARYQSALERAVKSGDRDVADNARTLVEFCGCTVKGIEELRRALPENTQQRRVTLEEFQPIVAPVLNKCAATQMRAQVASRCANDETLAQRVADQQAYCQCFSRELDKLDDSTIAAQSVEAYKNFQAAAKARSEGQPATEKETVFDRIEGACISESKPR